MAFTHACEIIDLFEKGFFESLAKKIYKPLEKKPEVKHIEIYANGAKSVRLNFEKGFVKDANQKKVVGVGLRVIDAQGREGMTFSSDFSDFAIELIVNHAVKMMKAATVNQDFRDLPSPSAHYFDVKDTYDPKLENICPEDINELLQPIYNLRKKEKAPKSLSGGFSAFVGGTYIWNSNGVSVWDKFSTASVNAEVSIVEKGNPSAGFDWASSCHIEDLDVGQVAAKSYDMAVRGLTTAHIASGHYPVVLSPLASAYFLIDPLTTAINAERVQNQMSFLGNALNTQIAPPFFEITDEPHIPRKLGTESFDAEGVATQKLNVVEKGVLKAYYHNSFTAGKEGIESNGHASRGSYNAPLGISNNNLIVSPGPKPFREIISDIKEGILLEYSGDSPDFITGDFSGLIMTGYKIHQGEIGPALAETMLSVNLLDALSMIEEISAERRWVDEAYVPWIKIRKVHISG